MLSRTLDHLRQEQPLLPGRAAVLVCPALTCERFNREGQPPRAAWFGAGGRLHEFVAQQKRYFPDWADYERQVALPALSVLRDVQAAGAVVVPNVSFAVFRQALRAEQFEALFLVAHRFFGNETSQKLDKNEIWLEFADGAYSLSEVRTVLGKTERPDQLSIVFCVCRSTKTEDSIYGSFPVLRSVGFADFDVPLAEGLLFLRHWIAGLDGSRTLSEAHQHALQTFTEGAE